MRISGPGEARRDIGQWLVVWAVVLQSGAVSDQNGLGKRGTAAASQTQQTLHGQIDAAITTAANNKCRVGARVLSLPQGDVVYSFQADELFKPASNMKVVTTAAAVAILGADFTFRTFVCLRGNDLVIIGDGDPGLGDPKLNPNGTPVTDVFHRWAEALERMSVTRIPGDLLIDDSIFDRDFVNPNWDKNQLQAWYSAPVGGLNFNDNCIDTWVYPAEDRKSVLFEMTPRLAGIKVINKLGIGSKPRPAIRRIGPGMCYQLTGRVDRRTALGPVTVDDPGLFTAGACRTALAAKGIRIAGKTRRANVRTLNGIVPRDCQIIAFHQTPLADVLQRANKDSQNLFAECLLRRIGYEHALRSKLPNPVGSLATGRAGVCAFLATLDPNADRFVIDDGSGLSHQNRISPKVITELLKARYTAPQARNLFLGSFSVSGVDGTLKRRMKNIAGKVHAKTGYIRGVRSLSGYVENAAGQWYCFSVLFDSVKGGIDFANRCHDQICQALATCNPG